MAVHENLAVDRCPHRAGCYGVRHHHRQEFSWRYEDANCDDDHTAERRRAGNASTLTFYAKSLPAEPQGSLYYEPGQAGWQDFLFENPHAEEVKIGLKHKSCECASFQVVLASPEWKTRRAQLVGGRSPSPPMPFEAAATQPFIATSELLAPEERADIARTGERASAVRGTDSGNQGQTQQGRHPRQALADRLAWTAGKTDKQLFNGEL